MAADFSGGTVPTPDEIFSNIYARANSSNPDVLKLVAVLDAVKQTIIETLGEKRGASAPVSAYFAALMTALERGGIDHAQEIFYLLALVLPYVAPATLRSKFDALSVLFSSALTTGGVVKEASTLKSLLSCVKYVLMAAEKTPERWASPALGLPFSALISFAVDIRPKVRKPAQQCILDIAQDHFQAKTYGCNALVSQGLVKVLTATHQKDQVKIMQIFPLVKNLLPIVTVEAITDITEALLALPGLGMPRLTALTYSGLCTLLESPKARLSIQFATRLVNALLAVAPSPDNHLAAAEFSYVLAAGVSRLASMERIKQGLPPDVPSAYSFHNSADDSDILLPSVNDVLVGSVTALLSNFESARVAVHHAAANSLAIILGSAVGPALIRQALAQRRAPLNDVIALFETLLQYKYQPSWPVSLPVLALLYRIIGEDSHVLLSKLTLALAELRSVLDEAAASAAVDDAVEDEAARRLQKSNKRRRAADSDEEGSDAEGPAGGEDIARAGAVDTLGLVGNAGVRKSFRMVERVLGVAIRAMGAHKFVDLVGLSSKSGSAVSADRVWVLPLLRDNAQFAPCPVSFFSGVIMPAIRQCEAEAAALLDRGLPKNAKALRTRAMQLWTLLPALFVAPSDFAVSFDVAFGQSLTKGLQDAAYPELPAVIARAFETVIARARAAAGLPPVIFSALDDDEPESRGGRDNDADAALTVAGKRAGGGGPDDDDEDGGDDDDEDDDNFSKDGAGARPKHGDDDGATTVFGAGGVSVHQAGENSPQHALLLQAVGDKDKLPAMDEASGRAVIETLKKFAKHILPVFFTAYESAVTGKGGPLSVSSNTINERTRKMLDAAGMYLSIAPLDVLGNLGERLLKLLVQTIAQQAVADAAVAEAKKTSSIDAKTPAESAAIKEATQLSAKVLSLLSLSYVLVPSLPDVKNADDDASPVARFFKALRPTITDDTHARCQKRAYAVLASLLAHHPNFTATSAARREEIVGLLRESLMTVAASARRGRLVCLRHVVRALNISSPEHMQLIPILLGEVMLCTKDTNARVRAASFLLLSAMGHRMAEGGDGAGAADWGDMEVPEGDEDDEEAAAPVAPAADTPFKITLTEFFRMLLGGFAASTPRMRSAAVRCVARMIYEFSDREVTHSLIGAMLVSALQLLKEKSREVAISVVGFVKVCVSCMPPNELHGYLPEVLTALMVWANVTKNRIRAKVKSVLERLVRKFGFEEIAPLVPKADEKLLAHMKKMQDRKEKKRLAWVANAEAGGEAATHVSAARTAFDQLIGEPEDISDDEDIYGDDDGASDDAQTKLTASTVARAWGIIGSRGPKVAASRMSAVTAHARQTFKDLAAAPLPPVGSIIEVSKVNKKGGASDAKTKVTARSGKTSKTAAYGEAPSARAVDTMLRADDDAPMDLLDARAMRNVVGADPLSLAAISRQRRMAAQVKGENSFGPGIRMGADGKLVIEEESSSDGESSVDADAEDIRMKKHIRDRRKAGAGAGVEADDDEDMKGGRGRGRDRDRDAGKPGAKGKGAETAAQPQGWGMKRGKSGSRKEGSGPQFTGAQFKGKSSGGDVQRKGAKFEPFAYVALDAKPGAGGTVSASEGRFDRVLASTSKAARSAGKRSNEESVLGKRRR